MFDFTGNVVIITGVSSLNGIGHELAKAFYQAGAAVAGCGRSRAGLDELKRVCPDGLWRICDVTLATEVAAFVDEAASRLGCPDIFVNSAAVAPFSPILDLPEADWDRTFDTNVKGYFLMAKAVAAKMIERGQGGCIVQISSISAHTSGEHKVHYCASKAAGASLSMGLALELAEYGIRVNTVECGGFDTDIVKEDYMQDYIVELRKNPGLPLNRLGLPPDAVGATLFLCTKQAAYITGSAIRVDGGAMAGGLLPESVKSTYRLNPPTRRPDTADS